MASPADSSSREAAIRKQNKGPPFKFLVPLVYAPVLPLIRITLRKNPVLRDRLFTAVLAGAFAHGFYLIYLYIRDGAKREKSGEVERFLDILRIAS